MSFLANKSYVALIELKDTTYYVTSRPDITLDGNTYKDVVTAWGTASFYSDAVEGYQTGSFDIRLANGEEYLGAGYVFNPTEIWNNYTCTIKLYSDGNVQFSQCLPIFKGKIKEYQVHNDTISFSVEQTSEKDDQLLPPILCENQTALTDGNSKFTVIGWSPSSLELTSYAGTQLNNGEMVLLTHGAGAIQYARIKNNDNGVLTFYETIRSPGIYEVITVEKSFRYIPDKFIDKTIPMQFGDLNDENNGKFGKTVTTSNFTGKKLILTDYISINSFNYAGVWDKGTNRFYDAIKNETQSTILKFNVQSGESSMLCDNAGIFTVGDFVTISDSSNTDTVRITSFNSFDVTDALFYKVGPVSKINFDPALTHGYSSPATITMENGEYDIDNNVVNFQHNNSIVLTNALNNVDTISTLIFSSRDIKRIPYLDEDNNRVISDKGVLSQTILSVDNELLMVISRPDYTNNTVYAERGFGGTTVIAHGSNSTVVIAETFGAKNLLSFRERFDSTGACNFHHTNTMYDDEQFFRSFLLYTKANQYRTTPLSNAFDDDPNTYYEYYDILNNNSIGGRLFLYENPARNHDSFNIMFDNIEIDAVVFKVVPAIKATFGITIAFGTFQPSEATGMCGYYLYIDNGSNASSYDDHLYDLTKIGSCAHVENVLPDESPHTFSIDCYSDYNSNTTGMKTLVSQVNYGNALSGEHLQNFGMTTLKELNKMPRMFMGAVVGSNWPGTIYTDATPANSTFCTWSFKLYNVGLWIDFLVDYTKETISAPLEGRKVTTDVSTITNVQEGTLCEYVPDVIAQILTQELGYETSDFTDSWKTGLLNFSNWVQWPTLGDHPWIGMAYNSTWIIAISSDGYAMRAAPGTTLFSLPWQFSVVTGWTAIAASEEKFVVVGSNGTTQMIESTVDGLNWITNDEENDAYGFQDVSYSGNTFIAVGYEGPDAGVAILNLDIYSGTDWTLLTLAETNKMSSIAYSPDGSIWFAVSTDGTNRIQTSTDNGDTFVYDDRFTNYSWKRVRYVNNRFVFIPDTLYATKIVISEDSSGTSLVDVDLPINGNYHSSPIDITYGDGTYAMTARTYTPTVGSDNVVSAGATFWGGSVYSINDSRYVAVKQSGTNTYGIAYSGDGESWTEVSAPTALGYTGVCYSDALSLFVAVNAGFRIGYSSDGISWTSVDLGTADNIASSGNDIACGSSGLVVVGNGATPAKSILYSSDATEWNYATTVPVGKPWSTVCHSEYLSMFVALGYGGYGAYSSNGTVWTQFAILDYTWKKLIYSEHLRLFVAVGTDGVMTSINGTTWTPRTDGLDLGNYTDIHYSDHIGVFVIMSTNGYGHSFDGLTWFETTSNRGYSSITSNNISDFVMFQGDESNLYSFSPTSYKVLISQDLSSWTLITDIPQYLWGEIIFDSDKFMSANADTSDAHPDQIMTNTYFRGKCAFSYGVEDDRVKGFKFVTDIANHYNYMINKDYEGKLDLVNADWIFTETPIGNEIKIEDILFLNDSGERRIDMYQTGNDMIYNDFIIKYNRNNSTDDFQSVYVLSGSYILVKSGIRLDQARINYYQGFKRTMEIESVFIYDEEHAQSLAEHKANMYAETHLLIELFIDYDHYIEVNSLTNQYKLGDIIYLTGNDSGIAYDSNRKFYIKNVIISDSGRELNLHLFSVDPVTKFSTS